MLARTLRNAALAVHKQTWHSLRSSMDTCNRHPITRSSSCNDLILLNVGGQNFLVRRSILFRIPHSRLHMVACNDLSVATGVIPNEPYFSLAAMQEHRRVCQCECHVVIKTVHHDSQQSEDTVHPATTLQMPTEIIYFDRDPEIFRYILDYHRNGELHIPQSVCGPSTRKELIFWGKSHNVRK